MHRVTTTPVIVARSIHATAFSSLKELPVQAAEVVLVFDKLHHGIFSWNDGCSLDHYWRMWVMTSRKGAAQLDTLLWLLVIFVTKRIRGLGALEGPNSAPDAIHAIPWPSKRGKCNFEIVENKSLVHNSRRARFGRNEVEKFIWPFVGIVFVAG